ncbi:MAG: ATP-dependent RNA helicase DbpA [Desulfotalea sp.]
MQNTNFSSLQLTQVKPHDLQELGYNQMTPVQADSLPHIIAGKDVIAQAKTGSGKTAAFGIGIINKLKVENFRVQTLVLCPTRELADQVAKELRRIARAIHNIKILTLCGGVAFGPQYGSLLHGAHIIVGTPGRVLRHLDSKNLSLKDVDTLVLDEADRMLDMGFINEIDDILAYMRLEAQTLLFSATFPDEILRLSTSIQDADAIHIKTIDEEPDNPITEYFYEVEYGNELQTILSCLAEQQPGQALIFCNTKAEAQDLTKNLNELAIDALSIHGDLEQYERVDVLVRFMNKSCSILVATDVAARGIDIKELDLVINCKPALNQETYIHRIGRTGRAGEKGTAITIYNKRARREIGTYKNDSRIFSSTDKLPKNASYDQIAPNETIVIEAGKKNKMRPGDILGALTGDAGLDNKDIGKIDIFDRQSYVAIKRSSVSQAFRFLKRGKIKGRTAPVWMFD